MHEHNIHEQHGPGQLPPLRILTLISNVRVALVKLSSSTQCVGNALCPDSYHVALTGWILLPSNIRNQCAPDQHLQPLLP